jgi:predicted O-linked N-acetylglucosamine transferase (SPINDLY family)
MTIGNLLENAILHHREGRGEQAEQLYREVLAADPSQTDALFLLSVLALQSGRLAIAEDLLGRAITAAPENPVYHTNLGEVYRRQEKPVDAAASFALAIALRQDLAEPFFNLGLLLETEGEPSPALACFERAFELKPGLQAAATKTAALREAIRGGETRLRGGRISLCFIVAEALRMRGLNGEATAWYRRGLATSPDAAVIRNGLGLALWCDNQHDEALENFRAAASGSGPGANEACVHLASLLADTGRMGEALTLYRRALENAPGDHRAHSAVVFDLGFHADDEPQVVLREARAWNDRHAAPLAPSRRTHPNDPSPDRRIRIGYVSPNFYQHCQSCFTLPLLSRHDRTNFEIFCYSDTERVDAWTDRIRAHVDHFRTTRDQTDDALNALIRQDRIDILVDLTMHMAHGRLLLFARKPAPIQICWLAYPGTTGLDTIDYRITDPFLDPVDADASAYAEESIRLPDTFWCYDPLTDEPIPGPLPSAANGTITFGCLNNFKKINHRVLALWSRVLHAVPGSRLLVLAPPGTARQRVSSTFSKAGIDADRIEFIDRGPRLAYFDHYRRIDIGLDPFPYNGHTTSLDAFWMGVPVVTRVGSSVVARAGLAQAMNLGLPELIAATDDDYVRIAVELSQDLGRLAEIRGSLRARMRASPLMDAARFTRNLETAYRGAWQRWCAANAPV